MHMTTRSLEHKVCAFWPQTLENVAQICATAYKNKGARPT